jgi:hypothetical protein
MIHSSHDGRSSLNNEDIVSPPDELALLRNENSTSSPSSTKSLAKITKKRRRVRTPGFRAFWVKFMKPKIIKYTKIYLTDVCRQMFTCQEMSIKRIKEIISKSMLPKPKPKSEREDPQFLEEAKGLSKCMLDIFEKNPEIEEKFPKYVKDLKVWFKQTLGVEEEPKVLIPVKFLKEIKTHLSLLCVENYLIGQQLAEYLKLPLPHTTTNNNNIKSEEEEFTVKNE